MNLSGRLVRLEAQLGLAVCYVEHNSGAGSRTRRTA